MTGKYYSRGKEERSSVESYDGELQEKVWSTSCRILNYHSNIADADMDELSLGGVQDPLLGK